MRTVVNFSVNYAEKKAMRLSRIFLATLLLILISALFSLGYASDWGAKGSCLLRLLSAKVTSSMRSHSDQAKNIAAYQRAYWKEVRTSRGKRLLVTAKSAVFYVPSQQKKYWSEVTSQCGDIASLPYSKATLRCLGGIVRRVSLVKHSSKSPSLHDLPNPFSWPFAAFRSRYRLSLPSQIAITVPVLLVTYSVVDPRLKKQMATHADELPGANYMLQLLSSGLLSGSFFDTSVMGYSPTVIAMKLLQKHVENFRNWAASGGETPLPRMIQMRKLGIITSDSEEQALNRLAYQVAKRMTCGSDPRCRSFPEHFAEKLQEAWSRALRGDPEFSQLSPEKLLLLDMLFLPPVTVQGHADLELLARAAGLRVPGSAQPDPLAALKNVSSGLDLVSLLAMANQILSDPQSIRQKQDSWRKWFSGTTEALPSFTNRPDIPALSEVEARSFDRLGNGKDPVQLKDELSYWRIVWTDPRFLDIKQAYINGHLDELDSLQLAVARVQGYDDIFAALRARSGQLETSDYCRLMGASGDSYQNILIGEPVSYYSGRIRSSRKLSADELDGCKIDIAELFVRTYQQDAAQIAGQHRAEVPGEARTRLQNLLQKCPLKLRHCPN